jgi:uncharacterized cupredoxin-like copper-binding protein
MKRITFLAGVGAVSAAAVFFALSPFAGARTTAQMKTTIKVGATEYKFTLSKKSAPHGVVVFKVTNKGVLKHDFKIAGKKTALLKHGQTATLRVKLTKGKHPYLCTVKNHAKYGMKGVFKST